MAGLKTAVLNGLVPKAGSLRPALDNIVIAGLLNSPTGLGQSARLCHRALRDIGYNPSALDLCGRLGVPAGVAFDCGNPLPKPGPGLLILHINAPQVSRALWHIGRGRLRDKLVVGYWAWELERVPPDWIEAAPFVHEIWLPSRFAAAGLARAIDDRPVRVVPHAVPAPPAVDGPCRQAAARAALGVPAGAFIAAFGFAMLSSFERKNPLAAIAAFTEAFGDDPGALLLLRCLDLGAYPSGAAQLRATIAGRRNIRLLADMSVPMHSLIDACDVYLSLHRSEGCGLTLIEAMAASKPVIATGWSGNTEFMSADDSLPVASSLVPVHDPQGIYRDGADRWAAPSVDAAAAALQRLRRDGALRAVLGAEARAAARRIGRDGRAALQAALRACAGGRAGINPSCVRPVMG